MSEKKKKDIKETTTVAPEVKEEKVQESSVAPSASPQPATVLSQQDTFVSDLVKEQPKTEAELTSMNELKMRDILELPEECAKLHKVKYRYRWLAKNKNLESSLRSSIWALCTRENSPYIKPHRFKSHGAVEQAGMLLAFATEETGARREAAPADRSAALVKHYTEDLSKQEEKGFYQPTEADSDDSEGFEMD